MLAQKLGTMRQDPSLSGASNAGVEFQNEYCPVANLTYGSTDVSIGVESEVLARLVGFFRGWQCAIGYNFWGRSAEKIRYARTPCGLCDGLWALKGDAQVIGFRSTDTAAVRLAAVEQNADIHQGTNNFPTGSNGFEPIQNPGVVNPVLATTGAGVEVVAEPFLPEVTHTSNPAPTLTACDIDRQGMHAISNSVFASIAYAPTSCVCLAPLVEIGGQAEFGRACALSTWGVWLSVGLGF